MKKIKTILSLAFLVLLASCASKVATSEQSADASLTATGKTGGTTSSKAGNPVNANDFAKASVIYFDFDKSVVKSGEASKVQVQSSYLKANANLSVTVEGHTDYLGTREYNLALGERRATSTKNSLVKDGLVASRIKTVSYGKDSPIDSAETDTAREKNRRTVSVAK